MRSSASPSPHRSRHHRRSSSPPRERTRRQSRSRRPSRSRSPISSSFSSSSSSREQRRDLPERNRKASSHKVSTEHKQRKKKKKSDRRKHGHTPTETISIEELARRVSESREKTKATTSHNLKSPTPAKTLVQTQPMQSDRRVPMIPQTQDQYAKEQSVVREVFDPLSGRTRLVKGSGEILERIVTRDQHRTINQIATRGDGNAYQEKMAGLLKK